jgi:hypothetical protein
VTFCTSPSAKQRKSGATTSWLTAGLSAALHEIACSIASGIGGSVIKEYRYCHLSNSAVAQGVTELALHMVIDFLLAERTDTWTAGSPGACSKKIVLVCDPAAP